MSNIIDLIHSKYSSFSSSQRRIADYIVNNPQEACFLSLKVFSEKVDTTEKTIINFTKKLEFNSFVQFKKELQTYISMRITPDEKMLQAVSSIKESAEEFVEDLYKADIASIKKSYDCLNISELMTAVEILSKATEVVFLSHNISDSVSDFISYRIRSLGISTRHINAYHLESHRNEVFHLNKGSVLFTASFPKYDKTIKTIAQIAKEKGSKLITLTDSLTSPIANISDIAFLCGTDTTIFYNSYAAAMVISNIIVSTLAWHMEKDILLYKSELANITQKLKDEGR